MSPMSPAVRLLKIADDVALGPCIYDMSLAGVLGRRTRDLNWGISGLRRQVDELLPSRFRLLVHSVCLSRVLAGICFQLT